MANPAEQWADKCNRATNDPDRIEALKDIAPAMTVPRDRADPSKAFGRRVVSALGANMGVLSPAILQLMAEAWDEGREEGYEAGRDRGTPERPNPYRSNA